MYSREYLLRLWEIHHGALSERHRQAFLARPELQRLMPLPREELDRAFRANQRLVDIAAAATGQRMPISNESPDAEAAVVAEAELAWREHEAARAAEAAKALADSKSAEDAWAEEQARRIREEDARAEALEAEQDQRARAARDLLGRGVTRSPEWRDRDDEISELVWLMVDGPGHEYPEDERLGMYAKWNLDRGGSGGYHTKGRDGPYSGGYPFDATNEDDAR